MENNKHVLNQFKGQVLKKYGYHVDQNHPEDTKYEVAKELGIPLKKGYNGQIEAKSAGEIGGKIGGKMVRELVKMAEEKLKNR